MAVEIKLSRSNRIYRPNETLEGNIITRLPSSISHQGIRLIVNGSVNLQVRGGSAGVIESIYGVVKPIPVVKKSVEVRSSGKIGSGTTEASTSTAGVVPQLARYVAKLLPLLLNYLVGVHIEVPILPQFAGNRDVPRSPVIPAFDHIPFSVVLRHPGEDNLEKFYETFHGGNISIQYLVKVEVARGYLHKSLSATVEFIIESEIVNIPEKPMSPEMVIFYITQDTQRHSLLPELKSGGFRITGKICTQCSLSDPISGELTVEAAAVPIHSIDVHLLRVESIMVGDKIVTETSLIQTTQVAHGDVCRNMSLPIYVILPRLLTCPTVFAGWRWKVFLWSCSGQTEGIWEPTTLLLDLIKEKLTCTYLCIDAIDNMLTSPNVRICKSIYWNL